MWESPPSASDGAASGHCWGCDDAESWAIPAPRKAPWYCVESSQSTQLLLRAADGRRAGMEVQVIARRRQFSSLFYMAHQQSYKPYYSLTKLIPEPWQHCSCPAVGWQWAQGWEQRVQ